MPKATITFVCTDCGGETPRWAGQCPHCQAWNTLQEFQVRKAPGARSRQSPPAAGARPVPMTELASEAAPRLTLAWGELNRVLGGGIVPGSLVLVGGEPGVGKSTLLMHAAQQVAARGGQVLYASGEESPQQIRMRAHRLDAMHPGILLFAENDLDAICEAIRSATPRRPASPVAPSRRTPSKPSRTWLRFTGPAPSFDRDDLARRGWSPLGILDAPC